MKTEWVVGQEDYASGTLPIGEFIETVSKLISIENGWPTWQWVSFKVNGEEIVIPNG